MHSAKIAVSYIIIISTKSRTHPFRSEEFTICQKNCEKPARENLHRSWLFPEVHERTANLAHREDSILKFQHLTSAKATAVQEFDTETTLVSRAAKKFLTGGL